MLAHLILTHSATTQLGRLLAQLTKGACDVYIHIDGKVDLKGFEVFCRNNKQVHLVENRVRINWGGFSMVEATLASLREIMDSDRHYRFINLLSGADYPLTNVADVERFLAGHTGKSFMEFEKSGTRWWLEAQKKIGRIHLTDYRFKGKHAVERLLSAFVTNRKIPSGMELVGRSQWFTMASHHAAYILETVEQQPELRRFFRYTWGADEFFFQTILYNSPFRHEIINDNLRYIDWSESGASPKTLTTADFDKLRNSGKFYARKFDAGVNSYILDQLDEFIS